MSANKYSDCDDVVLNSLMIEYFRCIKSENIPKTPILTIKLDKLEDAIRKKLREIENLKQ